MTTSEVIIVAIVSFVIGVFTGGKLIAEGAIRSIDQMGMWHFGDRVIKGEVLKK